LLNGEGEVSYHPGAATQHRLTKYKTTYIQVTTQVVRYVHESSARFALVLDHRSAKLIFE
jgi:hypothetical protein